MVNNIEYGSLDLFPETKSLQFPLPGGDAGVAITIEFMRLAASWGQKDPQIRQLALNIVSAVENKDSRGELQALYNWAKGNIRFRGELDETVQTPEVTLKFMAGDCDDFSVLIAALAGSIGFKWDFDTVALFGQKDYTHVYPLVMLPATGEWIALDATVQDASPGWEPAGVSRAQQWKGSESAAMYGYNGMGSIVWSSRHPLGYVGDDSTDDGTDFGFSTAEVLTAATPLAIGLTQAAQGFPVAGSYNSNYAQPGMFAPPGTNYGAASPFVPPGYGGNPPGAQQPRLFPPTPSSITKAAWFWPVVIGVGAVAVYAYGQNKGMRR